MNKLLFSIFFIFALGTFLKAQKDFIYEDEVYFEHIKSVKFHHNSLPASYPIIDLNSGGKLKLSFDDMEGGTKDYVYSIFHCDKNWKKSILNEMEYLEGFNESDIERFSFSNQTNHDYTHYELILPNKNLDWKISGNYILIVMDEDNDNEIILTKRFLVAESQVKLNAQVVQPFNAQNYNSHQRVDFTLDLNKFYVTDPMNEITITILQNNRWDNAIRGIRPLTATGDQITFNKFNTSSFPAGREYRDFDIRDLYINSDRIDSIELNRRSVHVTLKRDVKRPFKNYLFYREANGSFIPNYESTIKNGKTSSEYADVLFTLESSQEIYEHDVYVVGEFSSWKLYPENQMYYNEEEQAYQAEILLKQGYYNYYYATVNGNNDISFVETEGNWYETENEYTILVYYSKLGSRYDRLIGVRTTNSLQDN